MKTNTNRLILYAGLSLLFVSLLLKGLGGTSSVWVPVFVVAIMLKAYFLFNVVSLKTFKPGLWLKLIIAGVLLIFVSMLFKYVFHIPLLRDILFYGAIVLKIIGLVLMIVGRVTVSGKQ